MSFLVTQFLEPFWANPRGHVHHILSQDLWFLAAGVIAAIPAANAAPDLYHKIPHEFHFFIFEIAFALFFAMATKELLEETFPVEEGEEGGMFSTWNKAKFPLFMTAGGILGPTALFFLAYFAGVDVPPEAFVVATATDIAFSAVLARKLFGRTKHPAVQLLLALAVADDLVGMILIAVIYGDGLFRVEVAQGIALIAAAIGLTYAMRKHIGVRGYLWYVIPGALSWIGLHIAGMHTALAFVPIVPFMPHAKRDPGLFIETELYHTSVGLTFRDTLNRAEHDLQPVISLTLFFFAFMAAGVELDGFGTLTYLFAGCLIFGKPIGILAGCAIARYVFHAWPEKVNWVQLTTVGILAGVGFTVSLFVVELAFEAENLKASASLGALFSGFSLMVAFVFAKIYGIDKLRGERASQASAKSEPYVVV